MNVFFLLHYKDDDEKATVGLSDIQNATDNDSTPLW